MTKLVVLLLTLLPASLSAAELYVRGSVGVESTANATLRDRDCASTNPPALFGCVDGNDGRPLAARGDFGGGAFREIGVGVAVDRLRLELALSDRPGLDFDAEANFVGVSGRQPVHADGRSLALFAIAAFDVAPRAWRVRPFVEAGAGAARNELGAVRYHFPSIAPDAVTITRGGTTTGFAWLAGLGASVSLSESLSLDVTVRHVDLGDVQTEAGTATIIRPSRTVVLDIAGTETEVVTRAVGVGVRYRW